ncbi:MAG TPA: L-threonylcarbamoyladenylate synthase [Candidatus Paceibacterota bacterium]|nr:L-threonylcarbamoyladenylate synthase [Candidatus Paceibacterota bacterium]
MIVLYPTETVYGLGAPVFDEVAMRDLYILKGREVGKSVSWLVRNIADIEQYAEMDEVSAKIAQRFLPGPLTLVLPLKATVRAMMPTPSDTVGFRVSSDVYTQRIIYDVMHDTHSPLTCTSANVSGMPTMHNVEDILEQFGDKRHYITEICDGGIRTGTPTTVIEVRDGNITLFREGSIHFVEIDTFACTL